MSDKPKKIVAIPPEMLYQPRVFYQASQVERSVPCFMEISKIKVGDRLAVLEERNEFSAHFGEKLPIAATFYIGRVTAIGDGDDPLVTITYDGHPYAVSLTAGLNNIARFCIPVPRGALAKMKAQVKREATPRRVGRTRT